MSDTCPAGAGPGVIAEKQTGDVIVPGIAFVTENVETGLDAVEIAVDGRTDSSLPALFVRLSEDPAPCGREA